MSVWKEYKLGEIADINMGQSPKSDTYNNDKIGLPFLQGNRTFGRLYPLIDTYCSSPLKIAEKNDVLFSVRAPVGDINYSPEKVCIGRGLCSIRSKKGNQNFLFHLLNYIKQEIINKESGTVFGSVNKNTLENIRVSIPDLPTQKSIAEILSSIDDKIELNNKINQELETLAQTLFKQWFIDFEFPNENGEPYKSSGGEMVDCELGEIPKGWDVSKVKDWGEVVCGKTPPKSNKEYFGEDVLFIKIPDMHNKVFVTKSEDGLSLIGANSQKNKLLKKGSVILSSIATVGLVSIVSKDSQTNQQINAIIPHKSSFTNYLFLILKTKSDDFKQLASGGSATLNMNTSTFKEYKVLKPIESKLIQFENLISSLFEKIHILTIENEELIAARDILLPKLISGELEIKEIFN